MTFYDGFLFTTITTSVLLILVPLVHRMAPHVMTRWFPQFSGAPLKAFRNLLVKGIAIFVRSIRCCDARGKFGKVWTIGVVAQGRVVV
jgi:hypothetical protein